MNGLDEEDAVVGRASAALDDEAVVGRYAAMRERGVCAYEEMGV